MSPDFRIKPFAEHTT